MPPSAVQPLLLSPAELSYLHTSLSFSPPIRSDGRASKQFRPLAAETDIIPGTNGSARICFADGSEAIVGVKAEIEKTLPTDSNITEEDDQIEEYHFVNQNKSNRAKNRNPSAWVEVDIELPGYRDDDAMPVLLAAILTEALLADGQNPSRLYINPRFHWKMYLDILLLSQPLSYPLPLLSLTSHLALLSTRLPRLTSEEEDDPLFDDDWESSVFLYPREERTYTRPPVTLLVMAVKDNIIFDPTREELAVADVVLAVSVGESSEDREELHDDSSRNLRLLAARTIDPPSRLTHHGIPNNLNVVTQGTSEKANEAVSETEPLEQEGVWQTPLGGAKKKLISEMIHQILVTGGVADEVLDGLDAIKFT